MGSLTHVYDVFKTYLSTLENNHPITIAWNVLKVVWTALINNSKKDFSCLELGGFVGITLALGRIIVFPDEKILLNYVCISIYKLTSIK